MLAFLVLLIALALVVTIALFAFYKVPALNDLFQDAETLFLPALQAAASVIVGALGLFDWGPLASLVQSAGFKMEQLVGIAVVSFLQAVGLYIARKARDPDLKG